MKAVALVLVITLGGCSLFMTATRPSTAPDGRLVCSRNGIPAMELLVSGFAGAATVGLVYDDAFVPVGVVTLGTAVVFGAVGYAGTRRAERCEERRGAALAAAERERTRREALDRARASAWAITQQAATSARTGDCQPSRDASAQVSQLDAEFHAQVFLRDAAIHRCLEPAAAP